LLNYVWVGIVLVGILTAAANDVKDDMRNTYRNGVPLDAVLDVEKSPSPLRSTWEGTLVIPAASFSAMYDQPQTAGDVREPARIAALSGGRSSISIPVVEAMPGIWKEMAKSGSGRDELTGTLVSVSFSGDGKTAAVRFVLEPVRFVKMKAVTRAAMDYAAMAVTIAIGLIGVMALWLGVMKVAEEAGILLVVTRLLTPLTRRLFPDVPAGHPALSAMIMNMAANMLGLSNAATPLGLKAMEELNKLNPKIGTATNAMCTFLAMNTGGLVLIPATAIAVRAAAGSSNPGIIIGTSIVGASCATFAGVAAAKILERLPHYRKMLDDPRG